MLLLFAALATPIPASIPAPIPDEARLTRAVRQAIADEIEHGILATTRKDMELYMETVPDDYRIFEDDGSITDKAVLRAKQMQAWALITRTNSLDIRITGFQLGCGGTCALVKTDQRWDRQMLGKDGVSEHVVVTTQKHDERWELRGSRWIQTDIKELGGTVMVDGQVY